jgi:hypothetical protein
VVDVDIDRKRISLYMKSDPFGEKPKQKRSEKQRNEPPAPHGDMQEKLAALRNRFK